MRRNKLVCIVARRSLFRAGSPRPKHWMRTHDPAATHHLSGRQLDPRLHPLVAKFTCETGIQVKDNPMGSVDAARQITAGGKPCDLYAPADYLDIDLFLKPAGYAGFNIVFAQGKMVLLYSATSLAEKKLPPIVAPGSQRFDPPASVPNAAENWYEILTMPGVVIGGRSPVSRSGRVPARFDLPACGGVLPEAGLYNSLLQHVTIPGPVRAGAILGKQFDFQFIYEHNARAMAAENPDLRYVGLPDEINLSNPAMDIWYRQHASIVLPGLGSPGAARTCGNSGRARRVGDHDSEECPESAAAVKFLEMLLGRDGAAMLEANGPSPLSPAVVGSGDYRHLPEPLRPLVREKAASQ